MWFLIRNKLNLLDDFDKNLFKQKFELSLWVDLDLEAGIGSALRI
jgi:hypothetical protein